MSNLFSGFECVLGDWKLSLSTRLFSWLSTGIVNCKCSDVTEISYVLSRICSGFNSDFHEADKFKLSFLLFTLNSRFSIVIASLIIFFEGSWMFAKTLLPSKLILCPVCGICCTEDVNIFVSKCSVCLLCYYTYVMIFDLIPELNTSSKCYISWFLFISSVSLQDFVG